jgi:NADH:ubiquinone oxidoreductase subunit F (NADH-binding)
MEKYFLKNDLGIKIDDYKFNGLKNSLNIEPLKIVEKIKESNLK